MRDLTVIVPVAVLIMACVGFAAFRTLRGVLVPLSTIAIGLIVLLAIIADTVGTLDQVTVAVSPILIMVGFAYTIHVLSCYHVSLRSGAQGREAVRDAIDHVALPVVLTGLTACAGVALLATSPLVAIQQFGLTLRRPARNLPCSRPRPRLLRPPFPRSPTPTPTSPPHRTASAADPLKSLPRALSGLFVAIATRPDAPETQAT